MRARLEQIGATFLCGYHAALEHGQPETVALGLEAIERELRGFAFEGAAMGFALLDRITPLSATRVDRFLAGAGHAHAYMLHVGVGWVWRGFPRALTAPDGGWTPCSDGWPSTGGVFMKGSFTGPTILTANRPLLGSWVIPGGSSTRGWAAPSGSSMAETPN